MRYALYDDLHTEFDLWTPPPRHDVDVMFFAGDIAKNPRDLRAFAERVEREQPDNVKDIVFVAGNHEFYDDARVKFGEQGYQRYRDSMQGLRRSVFLEQETYQLSNGWTVIGSTLWTDLSNPVSESVARSQMNDYKNITLEKDGRYRKLAPHDTTMWHRKSVAFIKEALERTDPERTVLLTHHSPVQYGLSLHHGSDNFSLLDMYGARLENLISAYQPALALHGHTHRTCHRNIGDTWIANNPRGYELGPNPHNQEKQPVRWAEFEKDHAGALNTDFDPLFFRETGRMAERARGR